MILKSKRRPTYTQPTDCVLKPVPKTTGTQLREQAKEPNAVLDVALANLFAPSLELILVVI
jgi:hypothetical protein